ncbi:unnamed protein product [Linum tenue]|uniref:RNase H type-1 domain-containing protein n=1 Tax=Linum tenue TaxID=586396 RepID=A0AAV0I8G7_9ROSI|nr:unnamed protein product [Linum tenue]
MAWDAGARRVEVQSDSRTAIQLIQSATETHPHRMMIMTARQLIQRDWEVTITHTFREGNFTADFLASQGHDYPIGIHSFPGNNPNLLHWLLYDRMGVAIPRLVNV